MAGKEERKGMKGEEERDREGEKERGERTEGDVHIDARGIREIEMQEGER